MPDDINGNNSLVAGYKATTGQKVLASQHNPPLEDLSSCMTARLPRTGTAPMLANLPFGGFKATGMAAGTAPTDGATKAQVDAATPIGIVVDFAGATAPVGWLFCFGQNVSRTEYAALFATISTTYSDGDGSTTFGIPDLRGRTTAGRDNMGGTAAGRLTGASGGSSGGLGSSGGSEVHTLTIPQMPAHDHGGFTGSNGGFSYTAYLSLIAVNYQGTGSLGWNSTSLTPVAAHAHTITAQGGGGVHNNVQPTLVLNKIIKAL